MGTSTLMILAYATTGLLFLMHALYRLVAVERPRDRRMDPTDLLLLGGVAVLSSAAWILLLPVYGAGWLRSAEGHRHLERVRALGGPRRKGTDSVTVGC